MFLNFSSFAISKKISKRECTDEYAAKLQRNELFRRRIFIFAGGFLQKNRRDYVRSWQPQEWNDALVKLSIFA